MKAPVLTASLALWMLPLSGCSGPAPAPARATSYDPALPPSARTRILVLGSPHLAEMEMPPLPSDLEPLLTALERFGPTVIGIERMPPAVLVDLHNRGGFMAEVADQFGERHLRIGSEMRGRLGISFSEAVARIDGALEGGPPPDSSARGRLIAEMLAACEYESAVLQWGYLSPADRAPVAAASGLPPAVVAGMEKSLVANNEIFSVAGALARRLGLQRLTPIDDQTDAAIFAEIVERLPGELEKIEEHPETRALSSSPLRARSDAEYKSGLRGPEGLLPFYRLINSTEATSQDVAGQWGRYFRTRLPSGADRSRVAQWETRNLRIASNVRQASALQPGGRVLVLIGSAHKPFLDRYLAQMLDVEVVELEDLVARTDPTK